MEIRYIEECVVSLFVFVCCVEDLIEKEWMKWEIVFLNM